MRRTKRNRKKSAGSWDSEDDSDDWAHADLTLPSVETEDRSDEEEEEEEYRPARRPEKSKEQLFLESLKDWNDLPDTDAPKKMQRWVKNFKDCLLYKLGQLWDQDILQKFRDSIQIKYDTLASRTQTRDPTKVIYIFFDQEIFGLASADTFSPKGRDGNVIKRSAHISLLYGDGIGGKGMLDDHITLRETEYGHNGSLHFYRNGNVNFKPDGPAVAHAPTQKTMLHIKIDRLNQLLEAAWGDKGCIGPNGLVGQTKPKKVLWQWGGKTRKRQRKKQRKTKGKKPKARKSKRVKKKTRKR